MVISRKVKKKKKKKPWVGEAKDEDEDEDEMKINMSLLGRLVAQVMGLAAPWSGLPVRWG